MRPSFDLMPSLIMKPERQQTSGAIRTAEQLTSGKCSVDRLRLAVVGTVAQFEQTPVNLAMSASGLISSKF